ncbi:MAG: tRNA-dihydrouridine synthase, partial [Caldilineaceae bacterium]|nr:tRNA-dihydrouridine synthase [Caldilineaceae bacterium]
IAKAVRLRDSLNKDVPIVGNGDILSYQQGVDYVKTYGVDGIMVGRGVFQNIWIFDPGINPATIPFQTRKELLMKHITLFHQTWGNGAHFDRMKKYYKIYLSGMPHAAQLRNDLMQYHTAEETLQHLHSIEL